MRIASKVSATVSSTPTPDALPPTFSWKNGRMFYCSRPFWSATQPNEQWKAALQRNGFREYPDVALGYEWDPIKLDVYASEGDKVPNYLADIEIAGDRSHILWIDDVPELIDLLAHLTPAIAAGAALGDRKERIDEEDRLAEEERKSKRDIWK